MRRFLLFITYWLITWVSAGFIAAAFADERYLRDGMLNYALETIFVQNQAIFASDFPVWFILGMVVAFFIRVLVLMPLFATEEEMQKFDQTFNRIVEANVERRYDDDESEANKIYDYRIETHGSMSASHDEFV